MKRAVIGTYKGEKAELAALDLKRLLVTRLLVQAGSGFGKSWLLRRLLEQTAGGVQQVVIDSDGEFVTLREKYDYIIAARQGGDTLADPRTAGLLARRIMETGVSAILDISELKKPVRRLFVRLFLEELMELPRAMWSPLLVVLDEAHEFCLSDDTEILTREGFKGWRSLTPETEAVCFDTKRGAYSYGAIQRVITRQYDGDMVHLDSDGLDSLSTPDHRVVLRRVQRGIGRYKLYDWTFCQADEVPTCVGVPIGGAPIGPGIPGLSQRDARVLGWMITDGWLHGKGNERRHLALQQSVATIKRGACIAAAMDEVFASIGGISRYERPGRAVGVVDGRATQSVSSPSLCWYFGGETSEPYLRWLGSDIHRVPRAILDGASREQLEALYLGLLEGDGTAHEDSWVRFYPGHESGLADDFQEVALRLGISATKHFEKSTNQWQVRIADERSMHWVRRPAREHYKGIVWDVTVPTGAFVARRNGRVFVTGNCPEKDEAESLSAVVDVATRGRKRGYALLAATQRIGKFSKDAAAELHNKLIGFASLDIDIKRAAFELGMTPADAKRELSLLEPGDFYAFGPALSRTVRPLHVGEVFTTHPEPGTKKLRAPPKPTEAIKAVLPQLADLPQEAEAELRTIDDLKRELANTRRDLTQAKRAQPAPVIVKDDPAARRQDAATIVRLERALEEAMKFIVEINARDFVAKVGESVDPAALQKAIESAVMQAMKLIEASQAQRNRDLLAVKQQAEKLITRMQALRQDNKLKVAVEVRHNEPFTVAAAAPPVRRASNGASENPEIAGLGKRILDALAWLAAKGIEPAPRETTAAVARVKPSGGYYARVVGQLKTTEYISYPQDGYLQLTDKGCEFADPGDGSGDVHEQWLEILSGLEQKILAALIHRHPASMTREELGAATNTDAEGGYFARVVGHLKTLGALEYPQAGTVALTRYVMP